MIQSQPRVPNEPQNAAANGKTASSFGAALKFSGMQQGAIVPLASLILDGGVVFLVCLYASAAYWIGVSLLWRRRRHSAYTKLDLFLIRWGFLSLIPISALMARYIWHLKGFEP